MEYGLIGEHLGHSFSRDIHGRIGDYKYELKEIPREGLDAFMRARDFKGINVTIPYKQDVIPYLDEISDSARAIGAVNTIVNRGGRLYGYNTDYDGLKALVLRTGVDPAGGKVLILGTGGTSKTAEKVVRDLGAGTVLKVSRSARDGAITYETALKEHRDAILLINTTPCGMFPNCGEMPIDPTAFEGLEGVVDVIYNPLRTMLSLKAAEEGIPASCGLYMLVTQAVCASEYFFDTTYREELKEEIFRAMYAEKENIVLIGMPGSGKTTVGRELSLKLDRKFIDTDNVIREKTGKAPSEIIRQQGEDEFRRIETEVIREVSAEGGRIIATGGGAVTRRENMIALKQNGRIWFIDRPLDQIVPTASRPLSSDREHLKALYDVRYPLYTAAADEIISVRGTVEDEVRDIIRSRNS